MNSSKKSTRRHWVMIGLTVWLTMALLISLVGCERSKSSGIPTVQPTAVSSPVAVAASPTVVSAAEVTPTPSPTSVPQPSPTPLPTATNTPSSEAMTYTVQAGDTLYSIARRYNVTIEALMVTNGITDVTSLRVGQVLTIPGGQASPTPTPGGKETVHIVQRGENLFRIALRYGTTVQAVASRNSIVNPSLIWAGQKLIIPAGQGDPTSPPAQIHIVQRGENLYRIALRYGTTPWAIAVANGLSNTHYIYTGQRLRIP